MKITNETKIGILAAFAITILILGYNFLKGKNVLEKNTKIYAVFSKVDGLTVSNPVLINGMPVGSVYELAERDRNMSGVVVTFNLNKDIDIPKNSIATINQSVLGGATVHIQMGNGSTFVTDGDTLLSKSVIGLMDQVQGAVEPTIANVNKTLSSLDSLLNAANTYLDPATKQHFQQTIAHLDASSAALQKLLTEQQVVIAKSLQNVSSITENFASNNEKINRSMDNVEKATKKFADLPLEQTVSSLQTTVQQLNAVLAKANSSQGTLGLLMNDPKLYQNLQQTTRSLNTLLDDLRVHPKRYVNVSVFGKKDKSTPLSAPILLDSVAPIQRP
jgi:phospholipid/cholesterol/gamma-HCH transport system substrate-binding protein